MKAPHTYPVMLIRYAYLSYFMQIYRGLSILLVKYFKTLLSTTFYTSTIRIKTENFFFFSVIYLATEIFQNPPFYNLLHQYNSYKNRERFFFFSVIYLATEIFQNPPFYNLLHQYNSYKNRELFFSFQLSILRLKYFKTLLSTTFYTSTIRIKTELFFLFSYLSCYWNISKPSFLQPSTPVKFV